MSKELETAKVKGGEKSVFLATFFDGPPYRSIVYQIKLLGEGEGVIVDGEIGDELKPTFKLFENHPSLTSIDCVALGSRLYLFGEEIKKWDFDDPTTPPPPMSDVLILDVDKGTLAYVKGPSVVKPCSYVFSAYGRIFVLPQPSLPIYAIPEPFFESLDPLKGSWEPLPTPPFYYDDPPDNLCISGHAVSHDQVLLSLESEKGVDFYSYHLISKKWTCCNKEAGEDFLYSPFNGRAAVVGDTIFVYCGDTDLLSYRFEVTRNGDQDPTFHLFDPTPLEGLDCLPPPEPWCGSTSECLTDLGDGIFCALQSGYNYASTEWQYLCITIFQILLDASREPRILTLHSTVRSLNIKGMSGPELILCFKSQANESELKEDSESTGES